MTRRELLRTIRDERARLESTLSRLSADDAADVVGSITYWERDLLRRLGGPDDAEPYHALMARLVELSDEELNRNHEPLWREIASVTYEHYWEQTESLRLRLRSVKSDRPRSPARHL
jgi:hypothetical protein